MSPALATGTVTVKAAGNAVYSLLTDLNRLAEFADEAHAMQWKDGASAAPGARFIGRNRNGIHRWSTTCTVTDADPGRVFAFDVHYSPLRIPISHWRYDIEAASSGSSVTERMWDRRPGWFVGIGGLATGVSDRARANTANIRATLERLRHAAEAAQ
ncbi:MAG: SRPBCC family protein [Rhodococcus sp. (in: high G+C Gram-positive bacteria)]